LAPFSKMMMLKMSCRIYPRREVNVDLVAFP